MTMQLTEIENLSGAELKARRAELIEAAAGAEAKELAARYVQARLDAATRDAKLAEQGETITSLNAALAAETQARAKAEAQATGTAETLRRAEEKVADQRLTNERLGRAVTDWMEIAKRRRLVLAELMAFAGQLSAKVAPLLAEEG
jgi:uncharacterized coiled-coil protein SlyX